jgi:Protein of unknown function (DUF2938)
MSLIELPGNWLDGRKVDSIEAIEDGIATSLKALKDDRFSGLIEHASTIFCLPRWARPLSPTSRSRCLAWLRSTLWLQRRQESVRRLWWTDGQICKTALCDRCRPSRSWSSLTLAGSNTQASCRPSSWASVSVAVPFFIVQPSFGAGIAASRTPKPWLSRFRSFVAHMSRARNADVGTLRRQPERAYE